MPATWFVLKRGERWTEDDGRVMEKVKHIREGGVSQDIADRISDGIRSELHYQLDQAIDFLNNQIK